MRLYPKMTGELFQLSQAHQMTVKAERDSRELSTVLIDRSAALQVMFFLAQTLRVPRWLFLPVLTACCS